MKKLLSEIEQAQMRSDVTNFRTGDSVRVHVKIKEGEKDRIQVFEGVVIRYRKGGYLSSICVRKISYGVGVERVFPVHSPHIDKIELVSRGNVKRARLYYLRDLKGKAARLKNSENVSAAEAAAAASAAV